MSSRWSNTIIAVCAVLTLLGGCMIYANATFATKESVSGLDQKLDLILAELIKHRGH